MKLRPTIKTGERHLELQQTMDDLLLLAAHRNEEAHAWLRIFYVWAHAFDDYLDEPERPRSEVIGLCVGVVVLTSHAFFVRHAATLGPLLAVVAAQYEASLDLDLPLPMRDGLRLAGNQVILAVALLTGGPENVEEINAKLWPAVAQSQMSN